MLILLELSNCDICMLTRVNRGLFHVATLSPWHANLFFLIAHSKTSTWTMHVTDNNADSDAKKIVRIIYDFGPYLMLKDAHFTMPYTMHPQLYGQYKEHLVLQSHRSCERKIRVLFSGNVSKGYDNALIRDVCGILSRYKIIMHLLTLSNVKEVRSEDALHLALLNNDFGKVYLIDTNYYRINQQDWLATLSTSSFFLALSGVTIPLSHSLVEALAVGTIPITNYPDWLHPPLEHRINCMTFSSLAELDLILEEIRTLTQQEIELMRTNAIAYYEQHLSPERFVQRLLSHPSRTVYLHVLDESAESVYRAMGRSR